VAVAVLV
jgi:hypothetical protein